MISNNVYDTAEYRAFFLPAPESPECPARENGGLERVVGRPLTIGERKVFRKLEDTYGFSVRAYETALQAKLEARQGSVDVVLRINEELRILREFQEAFNRTRDKTA